MAMEFAVAIFWNSGNAIARSDTAAGKMDGSGELVYRSTVSIQLSLNVMCKRLII